MGFVLAHTGEGGPTDIPPRIRTYTGVPGIDNQINATEPVKPAQAFKFEDLDSTPHTHATGAHIHGKFSHRIGPNALGSCVTGGIMVENTSAYGFYVYFSENERYFLAPRNTGDGKVHIYRRSVQHPEYLDVAAAAVEDMSAYMVADVAKGVASTRAKKGVAPPQTYADQYSLDASGITETVFLREFGIILIPSMRYSPDVKYIMPSIRYNINQPMSAFNDPMECSLYLSDAVPDPDSAGIVLSVLINDPKNEFRELYGCVGDFVFPVRINRDAYNHSYIRYTERLPENRLDGKNDLKQIKMPLDEVFTGPRTGVYSVGEILLCTNRLELENIVNIRIERLKRADEIAANGPGHTIEDLMTIDALKNELEQARVINESLTARNATVTKENQRLVDAMQSSDSTVEYLDEKHRREMEKTVAAEEQKLRAAEMKYKAEQQKIEAELEKLRLQAEEAQAKQKRDMDDYDRAIRQAEEDRRLKWRQAEEDRAHQQAKHAAEMERLRREHAEAQRKREAERQEREAKAHQAELDRRQRDAERDAALETLRRNAEDAERKRKAEAQQAAEKSRQMELDMKRAAEKHEAELQRMREEHKETKRKRKRDRDDQQMKRKHHLEDREITHREAQSDKKLTLWEKTVKVTDTVFKATLAIATFAFAAYKLSAAK